jgi:hypothetical protein
MNVKTLETVTRALNDADVYRPTVPVTAEEFSNPARREHWIREKAMTVLNFSSDQHRETPLDIFVDEPFDFALEYDKALLVMIAPDVYLHVLRLETLLQMKTHAGRPQDLADVAELRALHEETSG